MAPTHLEIISSNSPFVQAIISASKFRDDIASAQQRPRNSADICHFDPVQIATIANAAFWASIAVEEGRPVQGVLCVTCPDEAPPALILSTPRPVSIESVVALTTVAPNSILAIHTGPSGNPEIWGIVNQSPMYSLCLRITKPGTVIASINKNVVALMHDGQISTPQQANDVTWRQIVAKAFGTELPFPDRFVKVTRLLKIVATMFRHGHGGILAVVPSTRADWRNHMNIKYQLGDEQGADLLKQRLVSLETAVSEADELEKTLLFRQPTEIPQTLIRLKLQIADAYSRLVADTLHQIGDLTAIDGAVVIGDDLSLFGFGAKLQSYPGDFDLTLLDVLDDSIREHVPLSEIGGTRHQSAARLVQHNKEALAFVASQDGHLTLFACVVKEGTVLGLRNLHHMIWEF